MWIITHDGGQVRHHERHRTAQIGWLRAAVLGANDGLISTASLIVGEYVSVSSQADTEAADLTRERHELATAPEAEKDELIGIYEARGLTPELARQVADQLMDRDALAAHAREELGLSEATAARPLQAALASAGSFAVGAALPVVVAAVAPAAWLVRFVTASAPADRPRTSGRAGGRSLDGPGRIPGRFLGCARHGRVSRCGPDLWSTGLLSA